MSDFSQYDAESLVHDSPAEIHLDHDTIDDVFAFPLSPAQGKMWDADRSHPGNPAYNASFRWNLAGPLNVRTLERTFNEIVRRHEILRATITVIDGQPTQLIQPNLTLCIATKDLRNLPPHDRDIEMDRLCALEARESFDLARGPLVRVKLLRLEDERHLLLLTLHHIVSDGWSIGIIMDELQKIYTAFASGQKSPLADLPIQYPDYVVWQQEQEKSEESRKQLSFWQKKLVGYKKLEVATDLPRPAERTTNSAIVSRLLPRELTNSLKDLSNRYGGTMFTTTLAAAMTLLHRYTGGTDIAIGTPLAGRNRADVEGLIGLFVNHIVLRSESSGDPLFPEFAARVRDTVWEALANQTIPFENVLQTIHPGHNFERDPFYLVNFICQREYARADTFVFDFAGIQMTTVPSKSQGALYDLNFFLVEREVGWRLSLEYNTDLYEDASAQSMLEDFFGLLGIIASDDNQRLSEFPLRFKPKINATASLTESIAAKIPEAAEKPQASDAPQEVFAMPASVAQERFWLLTKVAGGSSTFHMPACVHITGPLSTDLLEESFRILIARHETLRTTFEEIDDKLMQIISPLREFRLPVAILEDITSDENRTARLNEAIQQEAGQPFNLSRGPLFRAMLFKSGPENHVLIVTVHHILADGWSQNVIQKELWGAYESLSDKKVPSLPELPIQYSDFSIWQQEWLSSDEAKKQLDSWTHTLGGTLSSLNFPLDHEIGNQRSSSGAIETLLLPADLTQSLKSLSKSANITMFTLTLACFGALLTRYAKAEEVIVGSPVANRRPETEPLIGPFAGPIALRLDFSGPLTLRRILERTRDVTLEALGNTDLPFEVLLEQLQIRSARGRNPLFQFYFFYQNAFLQPRELKGLTISPMPTFSVGTPFEMQLGIVERKEGVRAQLEYNSDLFESGTAQQILQYFELILRQIVSNPDIAISELPEPRRPAISQSGDEQVHQYEHLGPRNETEVELTQIWQKVFRQSRIGVRDNFFDLGGQSLLAARLISLVEKQLGKTLDLSDLTTSPTIEQLAHALRNVGANANSYIVPLRNTGSRTPLFCMHCGTGHVHRYRELPGVMNDDQPIYGLRAPDFDGAQTDHTVEELAEKYVADIRKVQAHGPYQLCGLSFGGLLAYEVACRLMDAGEKVSLLVLFDTGNPAHYRNLPFSRYMEFRLTYFIDRIRKYARNTFHGDAGKIYDDVHIFVTRRFSRMTWKLARAISRATGRAVPKAVQDKPIMFTAIGEAYSPRVYKGRLILFRAEGRTKEFGDDMALGWDSVVRGGIEIHHIPGSHTTLLEKPFVYELARQLESCINDKADGSLLVESSKASGINTDLPNFSMRSH